MYVCSCAYVHGCPVDMYNSCTVFMYVCAYPCMYVCVHIIVLAHWHGTYIYSIFQYVHTYMYIHMFVAVGIQIIECSIRL